MLSLRRGTLLATFLLLLCAPAPRAAAAQGEGEYRDPRTGVVVRWRQGPPGDGMFIVTENPTGSPVTVRFRSRDVRISSVPTFGAPDEGTDWIEGVIPPGFTRTDWYSIRMIMPREIVSLEVGTPGAQDFQGAFGVIGSVASRMAEGGESGPRDQAGRTPIDYDREYADALIRYLPSAEASLRGAIEEGRQAYLSWEGFRTGQATPDPRIVAFQFTSDGAGNGGVGGSRGPVRTAARPDSVPARPEVVVDPGPPRNLDFTKPSPEATARLEAEAAAAKQQKEETAARATDLITDLVATPPGPSALRIDGAAPWRRALEAASENARAVGSWVLDQASEHAKGTLFDPINVSAPQAAASAVVDEVFSTPSPGPDRGSLVRSVLHDWSAGKVVDWLQDMSITAGAKKTGDPILDRFEHAFSAANPRNLGFGLYNYLTKFHDSAVEAISRGMGFMTGDPQ